MRLDDLHGIVMRPPRFTHAPRKRGRTRVDPSHAPAPSARARTQRRSRHPALPLALDQRLELRRAEISSPTWASDETCSPAPSATSVSTALATARLRNPKRACIGAQPRHCRRDPCGTPRISGVLSTHFRPGAGGSALMNSPPYRCSARSMLSSRTESLSDQ